MAVGETLDFGIWLLVAALLLLALAAAVITVRRIVLEHGGGTVECALRWLSGSAGRSGTEGSAWRPGLASYHRDELYWYRALGVLLRPTSKFARRSLTVVSRRPVSASEAGVLGSGRAVVEIDTGPPGGSSSGPRGRVELAMTPEALTGFLAWLEASPPSSHLRDIA